MSQIENPPDGISQINWCELVPGGCLWQPSTDPCGIVKHLESIPNRRARRKEVKRLDKLANGSKQDQEIFVRICGRAAKLIV